jgi:brefeldin A-resistance guanine nucleotide exchange factor 1
LFEATGLLDDRDPSLASLNNPVVEVEGQTLTVSGLSVRFGINVRCQLAAVVLFTIANGNGNFIRDGWTQVRDPSRGSLPGVWSTRWLRFLACSLSQIFEIYQTLFLHSLLPMPMLQMEDFLGGTTMIPLQVALPPDQQKPRQKDVGLLSTLSSYLLSPYGSNSDGPRVPTCTDSEVEATLSAVDCLNSCRFEELYGQIMYVSCSRL